MVNDPFQGADFSPQHSIKLVCLRLIENGLNRIL